MKRARRRTALLVVAVAAIGVTPFLVAATSGGNASKNVLALSCGQSVTGSVTLTADLSGCAGNGLTIGANGTSVNLNGHTISGSGAGSGIYDPSYTISVTNGTISGFNRGVDIEGGSGSTVQHLRATANVVGIYTFNTATISANIADDNSAVGIVVGCCGSPKVTITNNVVASNTSNGATVCFCATGSVVTGNRFLSNGAAGLSLNAGGATVTGNTANANATNGFTLNTTPTTKPLKATGNKAYFNTGLGISFGPADTDGGGNKAGGNGTAHQCENIVCS